MWQANIDRIKLIPKNDPLFWTYLTRVAKKLKEQEFKYHDDHEDKEKKGPIKYITLCSRYNRDGTLRTSSDPERYGEVHPLAWCFPGPEDNRDIRCKNPLYFDKDDKLCLTMWATGDTIYQRHSQELLEGNLLTQPEYIPHYDTLSQIDKSFTVPVDIFMSIMLT